MTHGSPEQGFFRGVASVPQRRGRPAFSDTADLPRVEPSRSTLPDAAPGRRPSLQPPRGMIVRRRWRRLRSGAGWSWTGVSFVLVSWLIWAVSVRGTDVLGPLIGLVLVLATGVLMFVLARLLGRAVLEGVMHRERPSAWPSHLTVFLFLGAAGVAFLQQTWWIRDSLRWLADGWNQLAGLLPS